MDKHYTLRFETRFVPVETDPIEMTPEQEAVYSRAVDDVIRRHLDTMEERILYGRPVSDVTVVDGQVVTRPQLPAAPES